MIIVQVVPKPGVDAYKLLRNKVTHGARTWAWANRRKTRLHHKNLDAGYIEVGNAKGVLVAVIRPSKPDDLYFLVEKFIGRLVAWFEGDLIGINLQFTTEPAPRRRRRRI